MKKVAITLIISLMFSNSIAFATDFNKSKNSVNDNNLLENSDYENKSDDKKENNTNSGNEEKTKEIIEESKDSNKIYEMEERNFNTKSIVNFKDENGIERDEFKADLEGIKTKKYLKMKTLKKYEVALANDNGTYSFIEAFDSYEASMDYINSNEKSVKGNLTIIDSNGEVAYAEESMGRIIKYIDGKPASYNVTTNIYEDSSLKNAHTYINHGYIDDVPVITNSGKVAKVMVSGYKGWINKDTAAKEYDLELVPLNQVVNPSYYIVENGELIHYISNDIKTAGKGHKIKLGTAPKFLKSNVKYYSYDGQYFYSSLSTLTKDLKNNNNNSAVNKGNEYYTYYSNLPFRSKSNHNAAAINKYIEANTDSKSKLRNTGSAFIEAQNKYGVNALLALGVAINESAWGNSDIAMAKNNIFGLKATDSNPGQDATVFATPADSIYNFAKGYISLGYTNPNDWRYFGSHLGNKNRGINVKYASDPFWGEKATTHAYKADLVMSGGSLNNIKDNNSYQLAINKVSSVINNSSNGKLYSTKIDTPVIVVDKDNDYTVGGEKVYKVLADRPVLSTENFNGIYEWNKNGYVKKNSVKFINTVKQNNIFKDITKDHWAKVQIEEFYNKGYIEGYIDGTFKPNNKITRAEFVKIINKKFGFKNKTTTKEFNDVKSTDWFYEDIKIAIKAGYIDSKNKDFRPRAAITREEAAAILTTIKNSKDNNFDKLNAYKDKNLVSEWAKTSVEGAIEKGYMGQTANKYFRPKDSITRAEAIVSLWRMK